MLPPKRRQPIGSNQVSISACVFLQNREAEDRCCEQRRTHVSHSSFLRRSFFAHALTRTNEVASDEYSGSWLSLLPAFTAARAAIGLGKSYPVTAAQLLPIAHG